MNTLCPYSDIGCSYSEDCSKDSDEVVFCGFYAYFHHLDHNFGEVVHRPLALNPKMKEFKE